MTINASVLPGQEVERIRQKLFSEGYAVGRVSDRDTYMAFCEGLGKVTFTRDILIAPDKVEPFTGYSYRPDEVPFHTDNPLVHIVGLYCVTQDQKGGENLLIDSRSVLSELTPQEIEILQQAHVMLPRSQDTLPILSATSDGLPHIYWLPAFIEKLLPGFDPRVAAAVTKLDQVLKRRRKDRSYISIRLAPGEAVWFNNYVMLHGRDIIDSSSPRHQVRVFISTKSS